MTARRGSVPRFQNRITVYDGRDPVGTVELAGGIFTAIDINTKVIGTFATLLEATRAFDRGPT